MKASKLATSLAKVANLIYNGDFKTDESKLYLFWDFSDKKNFLAAVKAVGPGRKEFDGDKIKFIPKLESDIHLVLRAPRNLVCKLVSEAVYDCEPLLSKEEESKL